MTRNRLTVLKAGDVHFPTQSTPGSLITNHTAAEGTATDRYPVVAWLTGSALVSINEDTLCQAGPVSTGMGDCLWAGKPPRFVTSQSGQLSLLSSAGRKMSTGQSAVTLCSWGVKAGTVHSTCG